MIYKGPGFLAVVWYGSSPAPFPLLTFVNSTGDKEEDWERETICWQKRGGGWQGEKPNHTTASLVLYKYSILSGVKLTWRICFGEEEAKGFTVCGIVVVRDIAVNPVHQDSHFYPLVLNLKTVF
jgi:hypothetical protein